jgi:hypothetical protein
VAAACWRWILASFTASLQEGGDEYSTVRFSANLLDYTVDERTGQVLTAAIHHR